MVEKRLVVRVLLVVETGRAKEVGARETKAVVLLRKVKAKTRPVRNIFYDGLAQNEQISTFLDI
jgi:hypothetical protein